MEYAHTPVMLDQVLEYLNPHAGDYFIDCTLGGGGYALAIAKIVGPKGKVLAIDLDEMAINNAVSRIKNNPPISNLNNIILVNDNFKNLAVICDKYFGDQKGIKLNGIIFDLGLSGAQLKDSSRGFSFQMDTPLNMAFGEPADNSASRIQAGKQTEHLLNNCSKHELERIIWKYGEEKFFHRIAGGIINQRKIKPITSTGQLVDIIKKAVPKKYQHSQIHFATRTFQAIRIAVNDELENLAKALPFAVNLLSGGGRIAVVAYHSLEDRIVKNFFRKESKDCICPPAAPLCQCHHQASIKILTKKIVRPSAREVIANPRSRSAKLRVAEKLTG
ncbi:16S rRNA (cytosine(1402)-N(4))-methyltransferase [Candidatus Falkowbacteria bacterium CG_4_8_14_3_um_filter_36_11]|nr:MAG: 16S rRNA (cytosine(1402)-N(4))-methyltransferase [Candidatus Falkowbacteria bacterium CG_4_8_14_3_um_filter_36_11]